MEDEAAAKKAAADEKMMCEALSAAAQCAAAGRRGASVGGPGGAARLQGGAGAHRGELRLVATKKVPHDDRDVLTSIPQWRQGQPDHGEPKVQVVAKRPVVHVRANAGRDGGDDAGETLMNEN